jgi:hypothetical protein
MLTTLIPLLPNLKTPTSGGVADLNLSKKV